MHFCPKCKYEYLPSVTICPDCGMTLVDRWRDDPESVEEEIRIVLLYRSQDIFKAQLVASALEQADIPFWGRRLSLKGGVASDLGQVARVQGLCSARPGEIYVGAADLHRAKELVAALIEGDVTIKNGSDENV